MDFGYSCPWKLDEVKQVLPEIMRDIIEPRACEEKQKKKIEFKEICKRNEWNAAKVFVDNLVKNKVITKDTHDEWMKDTHDEWMKWAIEEEELSKKLKKQPEKVPLSRKKQLRGDFKRIFSNKDGRRLVQEKINDMHIEEEKTYWNILLKEQILLKELQYKERKEIKDKIDSLMKMYGYTSYLKAHAQISRGEEKQQIRRKYFKNDNNLYESAMKILEELAQEEQLESQSEFREPNYEDFPELNSDFETEESVCDLSEDEQIGNEEFWEDYMRKYQII